VIYERLSKGKRRKAAEGGYTGGWIPYGYQRTDDRTIAVVPEEALVVERMFRWAAEGRSVPWIAARLREEKAPTRNGGKWRPSTVHGMLRNPFYTGRVEFEGTLMQSQHGAIVANILFGQANRVRGNPACTS
jgi:hypothetical protein